MPAGLFEMSTVQGISALAKELYGSNFILYITCTVIVFYLLAGDPAGIGARYRTVPGAPVVGAKFPLEPRWITRFRFYYSGWNIIQAGCEKYTGQIFTVVRPESNITVIPRRYVNELANIPEARLASNEAVVNDMLREYTRCTTLLRRHIGHHAVNTRLTPQLDLLSVHIEEELLVTAAENPLVVTKEWSEQRLAPYISMLMGRITSHLFLGKPLCRDPTWLALILDLVRAIYETTVIMRNTPRYMHPLLGATLSSRRTLEKKMEKLHEFLEPLIAERMANDARYKSRGNLTSDLYEKPNDVMQWMMDVATDAEYTPENMADRFTFTIMGSIRSVVDVVVNSLHELALRPEYIEPLREEMTRVLEEDAGWGRKTAGKLLKADSFLKETSRHYPPSALAYRKVTKEPLVLHDGTTIPEDAYICVATTSTGLDELANPYQFDGFRYYSERTEKSKIGASRYDYAATDKDHLGFGHGKYACPGRFAASVEAKMLLAHIILNYDLKLPPGRVSRPHTIKRMEFKIQDGLATTYMRTRTDTSVTFDGFVPKRGQDQDVVGLVKV